MPKRNIAPPTDGEVTPLNSPGPFKLSIIREKVVGATSASKSLTKKVPANARHIASWMQWGTAITLATATHMGLGTSADPSLLLMSGTTMTSNAKIGPSRFDPHTLVFSNKVASGAITNTSAATAFSFTGQAITAIPANTLRPGDVIRIHAQCITTAQNSTDTLALDVKFGTVTVNAQAAVDQEVSDQWTCDVVLVVRAIGASGTVVAYSNATVDADAAAGPIVQAIVASTALDTTAAIAASIEATWSVASTSNSCRVDILTVELLRRGLPQVSAETTLQVTALNSAGIETGTFTGDVDRKSTRLN